jgi:hypothetical protein
MNKHKTNLHDFTDRQLVDRLHSAERRVYDMKGEVTRRERLGLYGSDTPDLQAFNVAVTANFWTTVRAKDKADAIRVLEEIGWLEWDGSTPGNAVAVDDHTIEYEEPALVEEIEAMRDDAAKRLKKIEAEELVDAGGAASSAH